MTGRRPTSSGIMPNSSMSSLVTCGSSSPSSISIAGRASWPKPIVRLPSRLPMMSSRPTNVPPQMNRMLRRVHLDVLLLGMLAAALRRHVGHRAFEHLQQGLLHAFARHVAGDRDVLAGLADLVDLVDVERRRAGPLRGRSRRRAAASAAGSRRPRPRSRLRSAWWRRRWRRARSRIRASVWASSVLPQPVGPISRMFDLSISTSGSLVAVHQPLVVAVDGDGQHLLGVVLADDVLVELLDDLPRRGNLA